MLLLLQFPTTDDGNDVIHARVRLLSDDDDVVVALVISRHSTD